MQNPQSQKSLLLVLLALFAVFPHARIHFDEMASSLFIAVGFNNKARPVNFASSFKHAEFDSSGGHSDSISVPHASLCSLAFNTAHSQDSKTLIAQQLARQGGGLTRHFWGFKLCD